jgi:hypothetical protein
MVKKTIRRYSRYEQNTTKIPHKCVVVHKIYTTYGYLLGDTLTDRWTDARTDRKYLLNIQG